LAGQSPGPATATSPLSPGPVAPNRFGLPAPGPQYLEPSGEPGGGPEDLLDTAQARRKKWLLAAVAVAAVVLIGGIAVILTRHPGGTADPGGTTGHAVGSASTGSQGAGAGAAGRGSGGGPSTQPRITTGMIFPHAHVAADGIKFDRVVAVLNTNCTQAARGAFASALTQAGCKQVARATFVDNAKRYAITAGVAELPSSAAASQADRSRNFGPDVWFTGLDGPARSGATAVSKSVGLGYEIVHGPYIVYSLATYSSGRNPTGHAAAVRTLKDLARSFAVMTRQPLTTDGK
jgi:hypothetical protein